ncbi:Thiosulfate sulfurtransferase, rhodanese [Candidatus Rhodobacter oscarellae]|uniref:Thiosulfate sulfurtransferase, rhodanese n=1 Tax=Candidatus Rhodobacter oscarellae TaxID=1675527 RepID=A0A0J9ED86_9RHOB|nr:sulfurtransferase [Candidatus Rhodobacter lobularis]KMW59689.1 Thiosulfate sulfurtransferase, rhodanese [Candidatus Rhodobacter lobularis]
MTFDMTRRSFGLLTLGAVAAFASGPAKGAMDYANPRLLERPEALLAQALDGGNGRPRYEGEGTILVDVRPREDYLAGHIPGARHLEPNAVVAEHSPVSGALKPTGELNTLLSALGVSAMRRVVFYDDRGGFHAARMFWLLEYLGHRDVAVLNGGLSAWVSATGSLVEGAEAHDSAQFQAAPSPRRYASAEDVLARRGDPSAVLVDVRPPSMFVEGHIPWAVNVPWAKNLSEDSRFLPAEALRAHFASHGVSPDKKVIMHCQVGLASSHSYVALRLLGFPSVQVYHRSWAEWGADPSLPWA